jgi:hypothetical protein
MHSRVSAKSAAISAARERLCTYRLLFAAVISTAVLAGCQPATVPLAAADPAIPAEPVPRMIYRSTIAPYSALRPAAPAPWRDRNDAVAPNAAPDGSNR